MAGAASRINGKKGGRPKGILNKKTIEEKIAYEELRQKVLRSLNNILNSQLLIAQGETYIYKIVEDKDSKGKVIAKYHQLVDDPYEIASALNALENGIQNGSNGTFYYATTKRPDNKAIDSLVDRVFGKARQNIGLDGGEKDKPINIEISEVIAKKNGLTK